MKKSILITGGTGKVGKRLVNHFLRNDWNVVITSRSTKKVEKMKKEMIFVNSKSLYCVEVDLTERTAIDSIIHYLRLNNIFPNVLVNSARNLEFLKVNDDGTTSRELMMKEYTLNVIIPYELSNNLVNMKNSKLRSIINVSSIYGIVPFNPNLYGDSYFNSAPIQYSLSKAAVIHLTKELAVRFRKRVRVNAVSYGGVKGRANEDLEYGYAKLCPSGDMLEEGDTIGPVDFLASEKSANITGHNLVQDGGFTIW